MQMVWHYDIGMEKVARSLVMVDRGEHESRPAVMAKEWFAARCLCRDEIREFVASGLLSRGSHPIPSGAKAPVVVLIERTG